MLSLASLGLGVAGNAVMEAKFSIGMLYGAALAYFPAIFVMIGLAVVLLGWAPRLTNGVWLYLAFSFFVIYLGGLFQFLDWVGKLTPFGYVSKMPIEEMNYVNAIVLIGIAIVLVMVGMIGFNRRDIGK